MSLANFCSYYFLQQRFTTAYFVIVEKGNGSELGRVLQWLIENNLQILL